MRGQFTKYVTVLAEDKCWYNQSLWLLITACATPLSRNGVFYRSIVSNDVDLKEYYDIVDEARPGLSGLFPHTC